MPVASIVVMMGIRVATSGMLSRKEETIADAHTSTMMVIIMSPPVMSIKAVSHHIR